MNSNNQTQYHLGLYNVGSVDGRERLFTLTLAPFLSESALHVHRAQKEIELLIALSESEFPGFPTITSKEKKALRFLLNDFKPEHVADYDHFGRNDVGPLEHDVKAVEVYLGELFTKAGLGSLKEFIHFPATSEDINNLAWNEMLRGAINQVWLPKLVMICDKLAQFAENHADVPVLGITHGMSATPTTFGKRFAYFLEKFRNVIQQLMTLSIAGKFSGPTGNHNAITAASEFDFESFAKKFVESFGFRYEPCENQRNSHVDIVRLFDEINLVNIIAADLCENIRHQVMMGWLSQVKNDKNATNVGSSVMPHKINPWFFEVGQGYLEQSISMIHASGPHLITSVFERDLTDHPWERSYGEMIAKSLIGLSYICDGLDTLQVNDKEALLQLQITPEILTEAIQIIGRLYGVENIYMKIKDLSRGRKLDMETLHCIIDEQISDPSARELLKALKPETYIGKASKIAHDTVQRYHAIRPTIGHGILYPFSGIDAVLFDFDNTIHFGDKDELHARLSTISEKLNMGFSDPEIKDFGNRSDYKEMRKLMVDAYNLKNTNTAIEIMTEETFQKTNEGISGMFDHHFYLGEYAKAFLSALKEHGYKIGLVTTRGSHSLPRLLGNYGISEYFDVIISRDDVKERKPHPKPIALALEKLNVSPNRAVYIGDKQIDDVIAGNSLGMKTILLTDDEFDFHGAIPHYYGSTMQHLNRLFGF